MKEVIVPVDHNFLITPPVFSDGWNNFEDTRPPEYWEYRRLWHELPERQNVSDFPLHLDIDITNSCNLRCTMCPRTKLIEADKFWGVRMFDFDFYSEIISLGVEMGMCSVKYNMLGEPLMYPRIVDAVQVAHDLGVVDTIINTNACLLTKSTSKKLIEAGLHKLLFSFDSPYRKTYNSIRIGADYDKVLSNIRNFMTIREELGSVTPLTRASMVVMDENKEDTKEFVKLFSPIVDFIGWSTYMDHKWVDIKFKGNKRFCCPQLWQRMLVHADGVVSVCCLDQAHRKIKIGNVFETPIQDLWHGREYTKLRVFHSAGRIQELPICSKCPLARDWQEKQ